MASLGVVETTPKCLEPPPFSLGWFRPPPTISMGVAEPPSLPLRVVQPPPQGQKEEEKKIVRVWPLVVAEPPPWALPYRPSRPHKAKKKIKN